MSITWKTYRRKKRASRLSAALLISFITAVVGGLWWFFGWGQFQVEAATHAGPSSARVFDADFMKKISEPNAVPDAPALDVLGSLEVRPDGGAPGYQRSRFGQAWADVDRNGCDTRNDVLRRDLDQVTFTSSSARSKCRVAGGTMVDPYTAAHITFVRGDGTSAAVQIDHVVALADAWASGADRLDPTSREKLANDPLNLIAVDGGANQAKSAKTAAEWLPPNKNLRCHYVARQISVKYAYGLSVSRAEKDAMGKVLSGCKEQRSVLPGR